MKQASMTNEFFDNPIKILHRLKKAGFSEKQAEAQVEIFSGYIENRLVTKRDLKQSLRELELTLTIKTATIVGSIMGFFFILEKFVG